MSLRRSHTRLDTTCDNCGAKPDEIIDARTRLGPWAHLCGKCYRRHGQPIGTIHPNGPREGPVEQELSFEDWLTEVNRIFSNEVLGLDPLDVFGDWNSRPAYDEGNTPAHVAALLIDKAQARMDGVL